MMDNQDQTNENSQSINEEGTRVMEEDTYPISDNDSTSFIERNIIKDEDQGSMSEDSLINDEQDSPPPPPSSSSPSNSNRKCHRSMTHDEHIKSVKQKKEEVEILRLQKFQEQLRMKEQKWQQQQLERVKKWLQLRNRDTDHRTQVEERRRKREEEARAKFDEIIRREKEREQRTNSQGTITLRNNVWYKPDSVMSLSTDILSTRRATSAPRIRSNHQEMTNRRGSNDSPVTSAFQETADDSATAISSHQLNPIDEHRYHRSRRPHDATMTNEDSSLSGTPRSSAHSRSRAMPTSYSFWLNTGDNNNQMNANFMRLTYAASCRSRLSRSVERCPRACRAHEEALNNTTASSTVTTTTTTPNGEPPQRRVQSVNRQHLNETICRLAKPKNISMTQSTHLGATASSSPNGIPLSQSSHQLRVPTPPVPTNNHSAPTSASSTTRRRIHSRPATASTQPVSSNNNSRASPSDDLTTEHPSTASSIRSSSHRTSTHPKLPPQSSPKPPVPSSFSRSKPPTHRSLMSTSLSSSTLSSAPTTNKQNIRRIGGAPPTKQKPKPEPAPARTAETPPDIQLSTKDTEEESLPVNEETQENEPTTVEVSPSISPPPPLEPINTDPVPEETTITPISKREQQILDEQEYQRKLNQKIREAQQRLEVERQREEERQRQLEFEEYEREQEQIRLVEEQSRAEQERLQRAIEERERENELKRQEEQRLQQQREELERKQAEESERLNRERQERAKKEEEERNERKKRLDLIMRRTRQVSPTPKPETNNKINLDETNGHDPESSPIPHSNSDNRFPTSHSTENFLNNNESTPEIPKFKSPLIQNLLNKARNTRSTDNLNQSSMTTSQIIAAIETDEEITTTMAARIGSSDDEDQQDSGINNTTNGHSDSPLSSSTNFNSYHDHPIETATAFQ